MTMEIFNAHVPPHACDKGQQGARRATAGRQGSRKRRLRGRGAAAARGNLEEGGVHRDHGGESSGGVRQARRIPRVQVKMIEGWIRFTRVGLGVVSHHEAG